MEPVPGTDQREVRRATPADAARVTELVRRAYEGYVERVGRAPAPMDVDYGRAIGEHVVWVVVDRAVLVAVLVLRFHDDHLLIENLAVDPDAQRTGVGTWLLEVAELEARDAGVDELRLYTNELMVDNVAYYRRRGFTETHRAMSDGFGRVHFTKRLDGPRDR